MRKLASRVSVLAVVAAAFMSTTAANAANVIDQNAPTNNAYMAGFGQGDLAQSFQQSAANISGAGIYLQSGVGSGDANITISLWSNLPNAGGTQLAAGTSFTDSNDRWLDVFWSPSAISSGSTYYLVFTSDNNSYGIAGDTGNGYAGGQVFANSGYGSFPGFDYTFRTYADDAFTGGTPAVPEPATWAMMLIGFGAVGGAMRRRQKVSVGFA